MSVNDATVLLNPYAHEFHEDPYPLYRHLRDHEPVHHNPELDFYALTRYEDVGATMRDTETFISGKGTVLELMGLDYDEALGDKPMILFLDPPYHTKLRKLVSQAFTPRSIGALEGYVRELVTGLCDRIEEQGGGDFVGDFAAPLPMNVIFEMIGVPEEDREMLREWIDRSLDRNPEPPYVPDSALEAGMLNGEYTDELIASHRENPRGDLVSDLVHAEIDDEEEGPRKLTHGEIVGFVGLLGGAGNETITKLLANTVVLLQRHPDARQRAIQDRDALNAAIEESLRFWAPAQHNGRTTTRDVELHGVTIPAGSKVLCFMGSANRDERQFPDPDTFDIDRPGKEAHLAFGTGIHFCLGASLARIQARVGLETFLDRFPGYEIDEDRLERVHSSNVHGFEHAPFAI